MIFKLELLPLDLCVIGSKQVRGRSLVTSQKGVSSALFTLTEEDATDVNEEEDDYYFSD